MMGDRVPSGSFFQYSPSGVHASPHRPSSAYLERESNGRYLAELLAERQKLGPFMQVLPLCSRLLNQEIVRASALVQNQGFVDHERIEHESPLRSTVQHPNVGPMDLEEWSVMQTEENGILQRMGAFQASPIGWHGAPGIPTSTVVKKVIRLDVPVDKFPNYNFVGRLLGPRGNSLKRVEATTQCRVYIRGRGSVKDSVKTCLSAIGEDSMEIYLDVGTVVHLGGMNEQDYHGRSHLYIEEEKLRDKPGYEHLNEPLHVLVEAEFPADIIDSRLNQAVSILEDLLKPVDESFDYYKKQQLRELAMLNGTLREESPHMSPSMSPFNTAGMKRPKTGR